MVLLLATPAAVGLLVLGRPLTAIFLQRGAFDAAATDRVVWALQFLSLGLVGHASLEVVSRLFYAQRDMWMPFWAALAGLALNVAAGWALLPALSHGAIALGNSLGVCLQVIILLIIAGRRLGGMHERQVVVSLVRTLIASGVMGAAVIAFRTLLSGTGVLVSGAGGLAIGVLTFAITAFLLGSQEIRALPGLLIRRA
jgi:putative peptidoglycan lipid II flippase